MARPVICCDTSFLFSIYAENAHAPKALRFLRRLDRPVLLSAFNDYEIRAALLFSEYRGELARGEASMCLSEYESDLLRGRFHSVTVSFESVLTRANQLAQRFTLSHGARSFDLLHVASALSLGADSFLTFDRVQQKIAIAEGMKSPW